MQRKYEITNLADRPVYVELSPDRNACVVTVNGIKILPAGSHLITEYGIFSDKDFGHG